MLIKYLLVGFERACVVACVVVVVELLFSAGGVEAVLTGPVSLSGAGPSISSTVGRCWSCVVVDLPIVVVDGSIVVDGGSFVGVDGSIVVDDNSVVVFDGTIVVDVGSIVVDDNSRVVFDGSFVVEVGSIVVVDVLIVVLDDSILVVDVSIVVDDSSIVVDDGSIVVDDGSIVVDKGSVVFDDDSVAVDDCWIVVVDGPIVVVVGSFVVNDCLLVVDGVLAVETASTAGSVGVGSRSVEACQSNVGIGLASFVILFSVAVIVVLLNSVWVSVIRIENVEDSDCSSVDEAVVSVSVAVCNVFLDFSIFVGSVVVYLSGDSVDLSTASSSAVFDSVAVGVDDIVVTKKILQF